MHSLVENHHIYKCWNCRLDPTKLERKKKRVIRERSLDLHFGGKQKKYLFWVWISRAGKDILDYWGSGWSQSKKFFPYWWLFPILDDDWKWLCIYTDRALDEFDLFFIALFGAWLWIDIQFYNSVIFLASCLICWSSLHSHDYVRSNLARDEQELKFGGVVSVEKHTYSALFGIN